MKVLQWITVVVLMLLNNDLWAQGNARGWERKPPQQRAEMITARIDKAVTLTAEQKPKVLQINLETAQKIDAARTAANGDAAKFREAAKPIHQQRDSLISALLTSEQKVKYDRAKEDWRENFHERRSLKGRKGE
jgi:hypothetical protein